MKSSRSEYLTLRGRRLHCREWGESSAPRLFMLHGWGDASASFQFVVDALRGDWHVIAPDWRGFGRSEGNGDAYWFPDYIADLDGLLEHYSPDEPARIVGHSLGGNAAMLYAGIRPERVAGVVNLEGFGLAPVDPEQTPQRFAKWLDQIRAGGAAFRVYPDAAAFAARLRHDNPRLTPERAAFLAAHLTEPVAGGVRMAADPCHRWVNPVLYRIEEARACWRRVTAPTLWLRGDDSAYVREYIRDEADYSARLACVAGARSVELAGCGHNLHHDRPEEVARLTEEFFS